ncbi:MAG: hypothetical protein ABI867_21650 [Kofleriaceae bacterium]
MTDARHILVVAGIALAGCSPTNVTADAQVSIDAPVNIDLSCLNNPTPTTALDPVSVSGVLQEVFTDDGKATQRPLGGADIEGCKAGAADCLGPNFLGTTTSAADGTFTIGPTATAGMPLELYLTVTKVGERTTRLYYATPITFNQSGGDDGEAPVLQNAFIAQLAALGLTQDANKSMLGVQLLDCLDLPLTDAPNVVLSVKQNGSEVAGINVISAGKLSPVFGGGYFVLNVPVGTLEVGAIYAGKPMLSRIVETVAGSTIETQLRPGHY